MSGIWTNTGAGWELGSPQPFPDEATLHDLIQANPQMLPLAGSPHLTVLGSEVQLGNGYADILAVESSGRPAIIEVKLERNAEARRAVVSQVIAYAAFLRGHTIDGLEQGPLRRQLAGAGLGSIFEAVESQYQADQLDSDSFMASLSEHLGFGSSRLVLVLDEVLTELERVVAYLDSVTVQALTIDLITVKTYEVNGAKIALPQRVSPDIGAAIVGASPVRTARRAASSVDLSDGPDSFRASIADITGETRTEFERLIEWAERVAELPNVRLFTNSGQRHVTLLPILAPDNAGLVTIWNDNQTPYMTLYRSVFERRAPGTIESVERAIAPYTLGQGATVHNISDEALAALTAAYEEASRR